MKGSTKGSTEATVIVHTAYDDGVLSQIFNLDRSDLILEYFHHKDDGPDYVRMFKNKKGTIKMKGNYRGKDGQRETGIS